LKKYVGERKVVVARELSKIYEQIVSGTPEEVEKYFIDNKDKVRGEFVVLISQK
jgi:16S rRNA (cytidine1402-2'-O)-methyltransferase